MKDNITKAENEWERRGGRITWVGRLCDLRSTVSHSLPFVTAWGSEESSVSFACLLFDVCCVRDEAPGTFMSYFAFKHPSPGENYSRSLFSSSSSRSWFASARAICSGYVKAAPTSTEDIYLPFAWQKKKNIQLENIKYFPCSCALSRLYLLVSRNTKVLYLALQPTVPHQCTKLLWFATISWTKGTYFPELID